jgi:multidrug resistance efflux pump
MIRRILFIVLVICALVGLLLVSQFRSTALKVSGFIESDEIRVGSRVGGRVADVLVDEGETVGSGQPLIRLEPFELLQLEAEAIANLAVRQAELERLQAGYQTEEVEQAKARYEQTVARLDLLRHGPRAEEIDAARSRLQAAEVGLTLAQRNYERASTLKTDNAISQQEFEADEERMKSAQAALDVRRSELQLMEAGTRAEEIREAQAKLDEAKAAWELVRGGYRQELIRQAEAARDAAQASLDGVRRSIQELTIYSPVNGVVEALELQPGDLVAPGAPMLSLLDSDRLWVRAYVPENQLDLQLGDLLPLTVDSFPLEKFNGRLSFVARQAEFTPSNVQTIEERSKQVFRIKVTVLDTTGRLRPGMSADVWLDGPRSRHSSQPLE